MTAKIGKGKKPESVVMDYIFRVPTETYGNIVLGLLNHGQGLAGGKQPTEADKKFYRFVEQNNFCRVETAKIITIDPAYAITFNGASRSLSEVVEELYSNGVDLQQAVEGGKPRGLKRILLPFLRQPLDLRIKAQDQSDLTNSVRCVLLKYGLDSGIIPPEYLVR